MAPIDEHQRMQWTPKQLHELQDHSPWVLAQIPMPIVTQYSVQWFIITSCNSPAIVLGLNSRNDGPKWWAQNKEANHRAVWQSTVSIDRGSLAYTVDTTEELHRSQNHSHGAGPNVHADRPSHPSHQKRTMYVFSINCVQTRHRDQS